MMVGKKEKVKLLTIETIEKKIDEVEKLKCKLVKTQSELTKMKKASSVQDNPEVMDEYNMGMLKEILNNPKCSEGHEMRFLFIEDE